MVLNRRGKALLRHRSENDKIMKALFRLYWREPRLASQLSEEQRERATEKFLELVEKSREENAKRMRRIIKERNRVLHLVTKEMYEKHER